MPASSVAERIAGVRARIAAACRRADRDPASVTLVVVTKDVDAERALEALEAGCGDLGENRAQELAAKRNAMKDAPVRWHFIGRLQRNKVRIVAGSVVLVHSVDSVELGQAIARRAAGGGGTQDVLCEVNIAGEATKGGVTPEETERLLESLAGQSSLNVRGLMTIAQAGDPDAARRAFGRLRAMRDELRRRFDGVEELSMGMSNDFEIAIEEGATIVRVGTAIFGQRPPRTAP